MSGYYNYSMSNNAINAYDNDEMPLSKWNKKNILFGASLYTDLNLNKLTVKELKEEFLKYSSYHHTSKMYNVTNFYVLNIEKISRLTQNDIDKILMDRIKNRKSKEEIKQEKENKERERLFRSYKKICKVTGQNEYYVNKKYIELCTNIEIEKQIKLLESLKEKYTNDSKYKTLRGFMNNELKKINKGC